jgi:hypothetical protein
MKPATEKRKKIRATAHGQKETRASFAAYGDTSPICINADCTLRKKAGGCFGFEGCPGFKSR